MSKMSQLDAELREAGIDPEKVDLEAYQNKQKLDAYYAEMGLKFIGRQERLNNFPLDVFTDLVTGSTFLRGPEESVFDMVTRIRRQGGG